MTFIITTLVIAYLLYLLLIFLLFPSEPRKFATNYRIVKTTYKNNDVDYTIQQRFPFTPFWLYCHELVGMDSYRMVEFSTEKEAKDYLKKYTDSFNDDSDKIIKKEIV